VGLTPTPLSSAEVLERVELYLYSPEGPSWPINRVKPTNQHVTCTVCCFVPMEVGMPAPAGAGVISSKMLGTL